jgi:hypothetical protein
VGDMVPARKGCESGKSGRGWFYGNQVPFSPKEDLVQGKVEHAPRLPKGINTPPWAPKEGWSIHPFIREPPTRRRSTRRKPPATASPRSRLRHGLGLPYPPWPPCTVEPWRSYEASWGHQWYVLGGRWSKHIYYVSKVLHVIRSFSDSIPPFMILLSLGFAYSLIYT